MDSSALSAINAYRNQLKMMQNGGDSSQATDDTNSGTSFSQLVEGAIKGAGDTMNKAETMEIQSMTGTGKVDLTDLITAVSNAELTLNTVVAVRDKVIGAYQEIIRMSI